MCDHTDVCEEQDYIIWQLEGEQVSTLKAGLAFSLARILCQYACSDWHCLYKENKQIWSKKKGNLRLTERIHLESKGCLHW